jgi:hypothetical protein
MDRLSLQSSSALRFAAGHFDGLRSTSMLQSRRNLGSAADSHPADSPAMAVPETLGQPFATAKIVVWPGTCSVRSGHIIAARSHDACGDATLCACRRRGERTGNRCDRDKGSKCLLHSRPSGACLGHRIRSTECINRGWLRIAYCKVLMSVVRQNRKSSMRAYVFGFGPNNRHRATRTACPFRANFGSSRTYSITTLAAARKSFGNVKASALAVLRLIARSNFVGCSTERHRSNLRNLGVAPKIWSETSVG